jgi:hypothetical protein
MEGYEDGVGRPRRRGMTGEPRLFHLLSTAFRQAGVSTQEEIRVPEAEPR